MPTITDDFSDPEDVLLDDSVLPPSDSIASSSNSLPRRDVPLPPPALGPDGVPVIPKAVKIGPYGQLFQVDQDEFKQWDMIYPIYVDTKQPQQSGARRVSKQVGLEWPLAEQIAKCCTMLGYQTVFEPSKTHPKDWANPGRVRIQLTKPDATPTVSSIPNKRVLLRRICDSLRPHQPRPIPPSTLPPIEHRLPPNSPAVSLGTLDQALKGAGPLGMLGNMFGGGGGAGSAGEIEGGEGQTETTPKKKEGPKVIKPRKVHMKRR
ncbi:RNA-binding signal recognition particle subunit SEC65 [Sporobolomyces salmoneus]|uniref:RNA-binding signal recognition particle subunit SEC65 n=1 Tax=Sporobolomyces salmoneus TaxID=183962 RepID=UPI003182A5F7